jgi:YD repeat-containing protein
MASRKKQIAELKAKDEPKTIVGTHLTVTTHPDGRVELEWDDEQLLKEVREAIASVAETPVKKSRKKKSV